MSKKSYSYVFLIQVCPGFAPLFVSAVGLIEAFNQLSMLSTRTSAWRGIANIPKLEDKRLKFREVGRILLQSLQTKHI
jgi:hypothetical protein